jgi:hypothetical protein
MKKPQYQLQLEEKQSFLKNINNKLEKALIKYLLSNGIFIAKLDKHLIIEDLIANSIILDKINEYQNIIRIINDSNRLTAKRREDLLIIIYFLEDNSENNHQLLLLYESRNIKFKLLKISAICLFLVNISAVNVWLLILSIFIIGFQIKNIFDLYKKVKDSAKKVVNFI